MESRISVFIVKRHRNRRSLIFIHNGIKNIVYWPVAIDLNIQSLFLIIPNQGLRRFVIHLKPFGYYFRRVILSLDQSRAAFIALASCLCWDPVRH